MIYKLLILISFSYGAYSVFLINDATEYILIFLVFFSNAIMLFSYYYLSLSERMDNWSLVTGKVIDFSIKNVLHYEDTGKTILFSPSIRYEYVVNDRNYTSNIISFDENSIKYKDKAELKKFITQLIHKENVNVYYNQKTPSKSVLTRSLSRDRYQHFNVLFISGVLMIIIEVLIKFLVF